ncbi:MAG: NADH:quinone oxidoreductase, partial [Pseudomonas sp.]
LLGALREVLGGGSLLRHAEWLFGPAAASWPVHLPGFTGLPLFALAPGAFILLGVLWAIARSLRPNPDSNA